MGKIAGLCLLLQIPAFGGMKLHAPAADKVELRREGMGYITQKTVRVSEQGEGTDDLRPESAVTGQFTREDFSDGQLQR